MGDADRLDAERSSLDPVAGPHRAQLGSLQEVVLAQTLGHQPERHRCPVHGHPRLPQEVRQRPDVILVAVGEEDGAEVLALGQRVGEVRDHVVDAGQLVGVGEHEATVDGDEIVAELDEHHVEADLAEATEGDQPDGRLGQKLHEDSFRNSALMVAPGARAIEISTPLPFLLPH